MTDDDTRDEEIGAVLSEVEADDQTGPPTGIRDDEYREILDHVHGLFRRPGAFPEHLTKGDDDTARSTFLADPGHRLLLIVNAGALVLLGIFVALLSTIGSGADSSDTGDDVGGLTTTGSAVVEQVRTEAEQQLSEREQRIAEIELELARMRQSPRDASGAGNDEAAARAENLEAELRELNATAGERLDAMEANREQLGFVLGQLRTPITRFVANVEAGSFEAARANVSRVREILSRNSDWRSPNAAELRALVEQTAVALSLTLDGRASGPDAAETAGDADSGADRVEELEAELQIARREARENLLRLRGVQESIDATIRAVRSVGIESDALAAIESSATDVVDIVSVRALLRAVVSSPPISEEHPELRENFAAFFEAIERENQQTGYALAAEDAGATAEQIRARLGISEARPGASGEVADQIRELTLDVLESVD